MCGAVKCIPINAASLLHGVRNAPREIRETCGDTRAGTFCLGALGAAGEERAKSSKSSTVAAGCGGEPGQKHTAKDPGTTVSKEAAILGREVKGDTMCHQTNRLKKGLSHSREDVPVDGCWTQASSWMQWIGRSDFSGQEG